jgi:hypothetical protein
MTSLPPVERPTPTLLAEAGLAVLRASIAIRLRPFATVAEQAIARQVAAEPDPATIASVVRAVEAWGRRVPWRALCMEQGIAAATMLARRGYPVDLAFGAAMIDGELKAHVWVRSGDRDVIGCENAADFAILSQFSNGSSSSPVHS